MTHRSQLIGEEVHEVGSGVVFKDLWLLLFNGNEYPPQHSVGIRNQENDAGHPDYLEQVNYFNLQDDHIVIFIRIKACIRLNLSLDELLPTFLKIGLHNEGKVPWRELMGRLSESQYPLEKQQACVVVPDPSFMFRDEVFERQKRENI